MVREDVVITVMLKAPGARGDETLLRPRVALRTSSRTCPLATMDPGSCTSPQVDPSRQALAASEGKCVDPKGECLFPPLGGASWRSRS